jgi:hypothetical protein
MSLEDKLKEFRGQSGIRTQVWRNRSGVTASIYRSYKKDDKWLDTHSFYLDQLLELQKILPDLIAYMEAQEATMGVDNRLTPFTGGSAEVAASDDSPAEF